MKTLKRSLCSGFGQVKKKSRDAGATQSTRPRHPRQRGAPIQS